MRATQACSHAVGGEAKLDYFGKGGRVRGSLLYLASMPDRVRLDIVSPFGATISTLTSDGSNFALFDLREKSFLRGPANACNLQRFTRVPLPPHAFTELLRGEAPVLVHEAAGASIAWKAGGYLIHLTSKNQAEEEIRLVPLDADWNKDFSAQRLRVESVAVTQAGVPLYRVELEGHAQAPMAEARLDPDGIEPPIPASGPACAAELPRRIHFTVGNSEHDLLLVTHEVTHNPPLPAGVFSQDEPPGVRSGVSPCRD
jgi:hypothetical protein